MRQKRAKTYRKLMGMYQETFGFHTPFQILFDSEFCIEGTRLTLLHEKNVKRLMAGVVQDECKPMITQCCIEEIYKLGRAGQPTVDMAKTFERNMCNHKVAIPGVDCIKTILGTQNKTRYVVATQSDDLRSHLHTIPATPIVHIKRGVLVLEPPSQATRQKKAEIEDQALHAKKGEVQPSDDEEEKKAARKIRGPKQPNPLSVKKKKIKAPPPPKKVKSTDEVETVGSKKKRGDDETANDGGTNEGERLSKKRRRRKGGNLAAQLGSMNAAPS